MAMHHSSAIKQPASYIKSACEMRECNREVPQIGNYKQKRPALWRAFNHLVELAGFEPNLLYLGQDYTFNLYLNVHIL